MKKHNLPNYGFSFQDALPLHGYKTTLPWQSVNPHVHAPQVELLVVFGGTALHRNRTGVQTLIPGDIAVVNPHDFHAFEDIHELELCNLSFESGYFFADRPDLRRMEGFQALFALQPTFQSRLDEGMVFRLGLDRANELKPLFFGIVDEVEQQREGWQTMAESMFLRLVVSLSRSYERFGRPTRLIAGLARAVSRIETAFAELQSVQELAREAGMSTQHFIKVFKEAYHETPLQYVMRLRLHRACQLLKDTDDPISEIAVACGFADSNYFTRVFRKKHGMSPTEYRR